MREGEFSRDDGARQIIGKISQGVKCEWKLFPDSSKLMHY